MFGLQLFILGACLGLPLTNALPSTIAERGTNNACAEIRDRVKAAFQADPGARPLVPAQLGYDCLQSVPLHKDEAIAFVDSLTPYLEWQSTLADIKSPPAGYPYPGVDVIQEIAKIREKLKHDQYTNEYSYMLDIFKTVVSAHDGQLDVKPDILYAALTFARPKNLALVSYSLDGVQLPKIYLRDEIQSPVSSAVKSINGVPASQYIDKLVASSSGFPDQDAAYNSYFYSVALEASQQGSLGEFQGFGSNSLIFDGPTTTLTFENGTSRTYENQARIRDSFEGVTDGKSFYKRFCKGVANIKYPDSTSTTPVPPRRHAYPEQLTSASESSIAGYYLTSPGYTNIAVLSILDWAPDSVTNFQSIAEDFLSKAKTDKKKVILDLSSSTGGFYYLAYDLFKQFFPNLSVQDYHRVREHTVFNTMTTIGSGPHFDNYNAATATGNDVAIGESVFNYAHFEISVDNKNFPSYESKYGPITHNGDKFTDILRFNLSNPRISSATDGFGLQITGLGSRANYTKAPFAAEDIVLLLDGACISPCPLFTHNMVKQGKVKSIAIGGRPNHLPMQSSGGPSGLEQWDMHNVYAYASNILTFSPSKAQEAILNTLTDVSINRLFTALFNFRDIIPESMLGTGAGKGLGLNFVREDADFRLFYTKSMLTDPSEIWKKVAHVAWGGEKCAVEN